MYFAGAIIIIIISFYLFYASGRTKNARHEERKKDIGNRRQELLNNVLKAIKDKTKDKTGKTTAGRDAGGAK